MVVQSQSAELGLKFKSPKTLYASWLSVSNAMQMKNVELLVFLAVHRYSLPRLLPLMEGNLMTAYYLGVAIPLAIIPWCHSKTSSNLQPLVINSSAIMFRAMIRKTICCLSWIFDNLIQSRFSGGTRTPWEIPGNKNLYQFKRSSFNNYI